MIEACSDDVSPTMEEEIVRNGVLLFIPNVDLDIPTLVAASVGHLCLTAKLWE